MQYYQTHNAQTPADELEGLYPDVYQELYPFIMDAANNLMQRSGTPTAEMVSGAVDNIIKSSGLWDEDSDLPVQAMQFYRRPRRRHHNRNTLRDITRILLLREFLHRRK